MAATVFSSVSYTLGKSQQKLVLTQATHTETFSDFDTGPIANGDHGWVYAESPIDQEIVDIGGDKMLRMSSDPHSSTFAGPYSPGFGGSAGEPSTTADFDGQSIRFDFQALNALGDDSRIEVDFGYADATERYNFLAIESISGQGVRIAVNEPTTAGEWVAGFDAFTGNRELVSGVDASVAHSLEMRVRYFDGPDNDVVSIYLDGKLIGTSTTLENYYDYQVEGEDHATYAEAHQTSRLFFRANAGSGEKAPNDGPGGLNQGFYFDDIVNSGFNNADGTGNAKANVIIGNSGSNTLAGRAGNDKLFGGDGSDILKGDAGRDRLDGGALDDRLIGSLGRDVQTGGLGSDTFVFTRMLDSKAGIAGRDVITDFQRGIDKIDLSAIDAVRGGADNEFIWIGSASFHGVEGELRYVKWGASTIVEADMNGNGRADFQIVLRDISAIADTDFVL